MEPCCLVICCLWVLSLLFFIEPRTSGQEKNHLQWAESSHINLIKKMLCRLARSKNSSSGQVDLKLGNTMTLNHFCYVIFSVKLLYFPLKILIAKVMKWQSLLDCLNFVVLSYQPKISLLWDVHYNIFSWLNEPWGSLHSVFLASGKSEAVHSITVIILSFLLLEIFLFKEQLLIQLLHIITWIFK